MIVRKGMMDGFNQYMDRSFEDRMYANVVEYFPRETAKLGEAHTRQRILDSRQRAYNYDVIRERDVARFINLDFAAGTEFETADDMEWSREILESPELEGEEKIERIYDRLTEEEE